MTEETKIPRDASQYPEVRPEGRSRRMPPPAFSEEIPRGASRCHAVSPVRGGCLLLPPPALSQPVFMRRHHSPHLVKFCIDKEDPHFAHVEMIKYLTGEVRTSHFILASDLPQWIRMYRDDGFMPVEMDEVQVAPPKTGITRSKSDKNKQNCTTVVQHG